MLRPENACTQYVPSSYVTVDDDNDDDATSCAPLSDDE
jgi:hypothetical protein